MSEKVILPFSDENRTEKPTEYKEECYLTKQLVLCYFP